LGGFLIANGIDNFQAGFSQALFGHQRDPLTVQLLERGGMSRSAAHLTNDLFGIVGTVGGSALQIAKAASIAYRMPEFHGYGGYAECRWGRKGWELKPHYLQQRVNRNMFSFINDRFYSGHALDQMQNRGIPPSVVENTLKIGQIKPDVKVKGRLNYYDRINDVTVITEESCDEIVTTFFGER
jgi:hypothetical protein